MAPKFPSWGRLWNHQDFMRLWVSETIGAFGRRITALALPTVAILLLSANPFQMGLLNALEDLAFPLFGLFVGVWADRWHRRPMMVAANVGRLIVTASVPLAFWFASLHMYLLYFVAFGTGLFTVFFDIAYQSYLPTLVDRSDLIEANSKLETSQSGAAPAGLALGGFLIQAIGAALAIAFDALAYLASAILIFSIRKREPIPEWKSNRSFQTELKEGARAVFGNLILRRIAACTAALNLGAGIFFAVFLLFAYDQLKLPVVEVGLIYGLGYVGLLLGAFSASAVVRWLGLGRTLVLSMLIGGFGLVATPLALYGPPVPILTIVWMVSNIFISVYNINQISLRQAITPDNVQGRMNATMRTFVWGVLPLGSLMGGILGTQVGLVWTMVIGALVSGCGALWICFPPVISIHNLPQMPP